MDFPGCSTVNLGDWRRGGGGYGGRVRVCVMGERSSAEGSEKNNIAVGEQDWGVTEVGGMFFVQNSPSPHHRETHNTTNTDLHCGFSPHSQKTHYCVMCK